MISKPLSPEARTALLEFTEAYIDTLMETEVNLLSDIAKAHAIALLNTDIDILVVGNTLTMLQHKGVVVILLMVQQKLMTSKDAAVRIVEISEVAHEHDRTRRQQ